jgi:hypothetical protein
MDPSSVHAASARRRAHRLLILGLIVLAGSSTLTVAGANPRAMHPDPAVRRALSLLPGPIDATIEVIDSRVLSRADRRLLQGVCAFVYPGVAHIFIADTCPAYRGAERSLFEAIKLAGILWHELAHVEGADEPDARRLESEAVRWMLRHAPAEHQTPGMIYAAALEAEAGR